jgi:Arc/MetJ-type ribon-helix-helix transcriptional regulator
MSEELCMAGDKQHAHELIERLAPSQVPAAVGMLESLLDPVARAIAKPPIDDGPVTEEEERAVAESREWLKHNKGIRTSKCWLKWGSRRKRSTTIRNRSEADATIGWFAAELSGMNINLTPDLERIVNDVLRSGHFRSAEEVIGTALAALREKDRSSIAGASNGDQENAVQGMLNFVAENRTPIQGISVKQLIREALFLA